LFWLVWVRGAGVGSRGGCGGGGWGGARAGVGVVVGGGVGGVGGVGGLGSGMGVGLVADREEGVGGVEERWGVEGGGAECGGPMELWWPMSTRCVGDSRVSEWGCVGGGDRGTWEGQGSVRGWEWG